MILLPVQLTSELDNNGQIRTGRLGGPFLARVLERGSWYWDGIAADCRMAEV